MIEAKFVLVYNLLIGVIIPQLKKSKPEKIEDRLKISQWIKDIEKSVENHMATFEELKNEFLSNKNEHKDNDAKLHELTVSFDQKTRELGESIVELPALDLNIIPADVSKNFTIEESMILNDIYGQSN